MAKKRAKKQEVLSIDQVGLLSPLARELGVSVQTLASANNAGHVESVQLGCGSNAIVIQSAREWLASPRKRGRKPNPAKGKGE